MWATITLWRWSWSPYDTTSTVTSTSVTASCWTSIFLTQSMLTVSALFVGFPSTYSYSHFQKSWGKKSFNPGFVSASIEGKCDLLLWKLWKFIPRLDEWFLWWSVCMHTRWQGHTAPQSPRAAAEPSFYATPWWRERKIKTWRSE